jgi:DUF3043 family protein
VPSLFRRKPAATVDEAPADTAADPAPTPLTGAPGNSPGRRYTPSKRERGVATPKRPSAQVRRAEPPPGNRREAARRMRDKQRAARAEQRAGMMAGDERYLMPRDRGPERALVRDLVDSRRTVGTWFFAGAFVVLIGSSAAMPPVVQLASNMLWIALAAGTIGDSVLISRRVRREVRARFPRTDQRLGGLYTYAVMRALTFRRMRVPKPRVALGTKI